MGTEDPIPRTVEWRDGVVRLVDQRRLPGRLRFLDCRTVDEVCEAISSLAVRGAPALGATGGYGVALACHLAAGDAPAAGAGAVARAAAAAAAKLVATRPTAVNLAWAADRVVAAADAAARAAEGGPRGGVGGAGRGAGDEGGGGGGSAGEGTGVAHKDGVGGVGGSGAAGSEAVRRAALEEAHRIAEQDVADNRAIGRHGLRLVPPGARILTHCNAGALACVGYGTALGVIRAAAEAGRGPRVWVDETRPVLQGARLTAWELDRLEIPATLVADVMAGSLMASGDVDLVVVGADRVAANGDVANKIGTYTLAVLARHHGVPFYVAAPTSTIDLATGTGAEIPVEERSPEEVRKVGRSRLAPPGIAALNRAFDITPADLVTGIVTELGVAHPPYGRSLRRLVEAAPHQRPLKASSPP